MSLVVLDIECIESNIVKELGVYKDGQTEGYSFLPPKKFKSTSQSFWCTQHLHGINWSIGYEKHTELEKIKKKSRSHRHGIFLQKVMKNVRFYQNFWKQRLLIWMTTLALKFSF